MKDKYYLITDDLNIFGVFEEAQLKEDHVIKDVGTNMFIANSLTSSYYQLSSLEIDLVKLLIKHESNLLKEL